VALYELTQELTEAASRPAYEISNHAAPGAECRHNLIYWHYGDYVGVGPGAHGRLNIGGKRLATLCERLPERWQDKVRREGHGIAETAEISPAEAAREHLLMGLRLREGIDLDAYRARWRTAPDAERIAALVGAGFLAQADTRLAATPKGVLVLNRLIAELAP
ncbi:MAG: coproporphyrinogen III oxidase, partial [Pseudomonadota bacterium]|nr:coproporphyrinogen III oxidase [Pseudomonadota bacterium]